MLIPRLFKKILKLTPNLPGFPRLDWKLNNFIRTTCTPGHSCNYPSSQLYGITTMQKTVRMPYKHSKSEQWSQRLWPWYASSISENADPLGFSQNGTKKPPKKTSSEWRFYRFIQPWWAEKQLRMRNTSNLNVDGLQKQKTMSGSTPVSWEQESEATTGTGSP